MPGTLIVGLGIGFTFPVLSAAAVASLPPHRFSVGSAVNQTARQIGGAIGIAILVVIIGAPGTATEMVGRFHHLWLYSAATALGSGVIGGFIPRPSGAARSVVDELSQEAAVSDADLPLVQSH